MNCTNGVLGRWGRTGIAPMSRTRIRAINSWRPGMMARSDVDGWSDHLALVKCRIRTQESDEADASSTYCFASTAIRPRRMPEGIGTLVSRTDNRPPARPLRCACRRPSSGPSRHKRGTSEASAPAISSFRLVSGQPSGFPQTEQRLSNVSRLHIACAEISHAQSRASALRRPSGSMGIIESCGTALPSQLIGANLASVHSFVRNGHEPVLKKDLLVASPL